MEDEDLGFDPDDEWALFDMEPEEEPTPSMAREVLRFAAAHRVRPPWWAIDVLVQVNEEVELIWNGNYSLRETGDLVLKALGLDASERNRDNSEFESFLRASAVDQFLREEEKRTGRRPPNLEAYAALAAKGKKGDSERTWERAYQRHREFFERRRRDSGSD